MILFLDIDGVLNCKNSKTYYDINCPESYGIDMKLWDNVKSLLNRFSDIKVVIHSGWIKHKDDPNYEWEIGKGVKVKTLLPKVIELLGDRYIGCVDYIKGQPKSERIKKWIIDNIGCEEYAGRAIVIDDDTTEYTNLLSLANIDGFVVFFTNSNFGFDKFEFDRLINELNSMVTTMPN